ncbi:MAG: hypothetical protein R2877_07875 [Bdellovibrionota bacterium]
MIVVVDLDKTLLKIDSFPAWYFYNLRHSAVSNPLLFAHMFYLGFKRALGLISHVTFKENLMKMLDKSDFHELFAKDLSKHLRIDLADHLKKLQEDATLILSTAAPNHYVQHLPNIFRFNLTKFSPATSSSKI